MLNIKIENEATDLYSFNTESAIFDIKQHLSYSELTEVISAINSMKSILELCKEQLGEPGMKDHVTTKVFDEADLIF